MSEKFFAETQARILQFQKGKSLIIAKFKKLLAGKCTLCKEAASQLICLNTLSTFCKKCVRVEGETADEYLSEKEILGLKVKQLYEPEIKKLQEMESQISKQIKDIYNNTETQLNNNYQKSYERNIKIKEAIVLAHKSNCDPYFYKILTEGLIRLQYDSNNSDPQYITLIIKRLEEEVGLKIDQFRDNLLRSYSLPISKKISEMFAVSLAYNLQNRDGLLVDKNNSAKTFSIQAQGTLKIGKQTTLKNVLQVVNFGYNFLALTSNNIVMLQNRTFEEKLYTTLPQEAVSMASVRDVVVVLGKSGSIYQLEGVNPVEIWKQDSPSISACRFDNSLYILKEKHIVKVELSSKKRQIFADSIDDSQFYNLAALALSAEDGSVFVADQDRVIKFNKGVATDFSLLAIQYKKINSIYVDSSNRLLISDQQDNLIHRYDLTLKASEE